MFSVSEAEAAAIRAAFEQSGELGAAIEVRRLFPGITDNARALEMRSDHRRLAATALPTLHGFAAASAQEAPAR